MAQPLVLTRLRQDVSAGKCVAGLISPPQQHTSCPSKVISASASIANLLHRARMPWIQEHTCDSWFWDLPKTEALAAQPRTAWVLADFLYFFVHNTESEHCFLLETWTAETCTVLLASVLRQVDVAVCQDKTCSSKGFCITLRVLLCT